MPTITYLGSHLQYLMVNPLQEQWPGTPELYGFYILLFCNFCFDHEVGAT